MRQPTLKRVDGGIVVSAGFVPTRRILQFLLDILTVWKGGTVETRKAGPAGAVGLPPMVRKADKRLMDHV